MGWGVGINVGSGQKVELHEVSVLEHEVAPQHDDFPDAQVVQAPSNSDK